MFDRISSRLTHRLAQGATGDPFIDGVLQDSMQHVEAYSCELYRVCCLDPSLLAGMNGTCTREHTGASVGAAVRCPPPRPFEQRSRLRPPLGSPKHHCVNVDPIV